MMLLYGLGVIVVIACVLYGLNYFSKKEGFANPEYNYTPSEIPANKGVAEMMPEHQSIQPEDLLPSNQLDDDFAKSNPFGEGDLQNKDFLEVGRTVAVPRDTFKNSPLDLRGVPVIEKVQLSPWNNSTKSNRVHQSIGDHI